MKPDAVDDNFEKQWDDDDSLPRTVSSDENDCGGIYGSLGNRSTGVAKATATTAWTESQNYVQTE